MQIFITDDTNIAWDHRFNFFVYGGLVLSGLTARSLAQQLIMLKNCFSIPNIRPIKWSNSRWNGQAPLEGSVHKGLKQQILDAVAASDAKIIVCLSPQGFYHIPIVVEEGIRYSIDNETQKRTQEYGLSDALEKFNRYLYTIDDVGIVFADRFGDGIKAHMDNHCRQIFCAPVGSRFSNIVHPVLQIDNEDSYLHQINDVVLGSVYFSLRDIGFNFLPVIRNNFWLNSVGDYKSILGYGFSIYPLVPRADHYKAVKLQLEERFLRLLLDN